MADDRDDVKLTKAVSIALAHSLGNKDRDFQINPLTQEEIQAIVFTYSKEAKNPNLDPEIREVYLESIKILEKHLIFH